MSRTALTTFVVVVAAGFSGAGGLNPHLDPTEILTGCSACHRGHGEPNSPMLGRAQKPLCLSCHGSQSGFDMMVRTGVIAGTARPVLLSATLAKPFVHPISDAAHSSDDPLAVTCTSCHSPHRSLIDPATAGPPSGRPRLSPKDPTRYEFELCLACHGGAANNPGLTAIARLFDPTSRSKHPVTMPSNDSSPSVPPTLAGGQISCTDCHGNDDPGGPAGPHGSRISFILAFNYTFVDGGAESPQTYALCYRCHDRRAVLESPRFPGHARHIEIERSSCATCHDPHGAIGNRALIRFGEEMQLASVAPSASTGRLAFISDAPGSGACYLTCHGKDHAPEGYGSLKLGIGEGLSAPRVQALPRNDPRQRQ